MLKRPKASDTEEDLLRFQEEYLASQAAPSAKLIKITPQKADRDVVNFGGGEFWRQLANSKL